MFEFLKNLFGKKKEEEAFPLSYISNNVVTKKTSTEIPVENFETEHVAVPTPEQKSQVKISEPEIKTSTSQFKSDDWMSFEKDGKYGFEDENDKVVIEAQFDEAEEFENGLVVVTIDEKKGVINESGKFILPCEYDYIFPLEEERMLVEKDDLMGFADANGNIVIPIQYTYTSCFSEGLAATDVEGMTGYIDKNGKTIIDFKFTDGGSFSEGLAYAEEEKSGKVGFIDKTGKFVIRPVYDKAESFSEGIAAVCSNKLWAFITRDAKIICQPKFYGAEEFHRGLICVQSEEKGKWGFADPRGQIIIPCKYDYSSDFGDDDRAMVKYKGKYIYIDKLGNEKKYGE